MTRTAPAAGGDHRRGEPEKLLISRLEAARAAPCEARERFRQLVLEALCQEEPQGAKRLAAFARERGFKRRQVTLRDWLQEFAVDAGSGIDGDADGYVRAGGSP